MQILDKWKIVFWSDIILNNLGKLYFDQTLSWTILENCILIRHYLGLKVHLVPMNVSSSDTQHSTPVEGELFVKTIDSNSLQWQIDLRVSASPTLTWKLWLGFVIWLQIKLSINKMYQKPQPQLNCHQLSLPALPAGPDQWPCYVLSKCFQQHLCTNPHHYHKQILIWIKCTPSALPQ